MLKLRLPGSGAVARPGSASDATIPNASAVGPWVATATLGGSGAMFLGWLFSAGFVGLGWLERPDVSMAQVLDLVGRVWLLAHGVRIELGNITVSLVPLGLVGIVGLALAVASSYAAGQMGDVTAKQWQAAGRLVAVASSAYVLPAFLVGTFVGEPIHGVTLLLWAIPLAVVASTLGAAHGLRLRAPAWLPSWWDGAVRGSSLALVVALVGATGALAVAIATSWERVVASQTELGQQPLGNALMVGVQLAYLPNAVIWVGAFLAGTGFSVGAETVVSPGEVIIGPLPDVPLMLAVPQASGAADWAWLVVPLGGLLLGGWASARTLSKRPWTAAATGACSGIFTGATWVGLLWLSRGDLGTQRLTDMGPIFPAGLIALPVAVAVSAVAALATTFLVRTKAEDAQPTETARPKPEPSEDHQSSLAGADDATVPIVRDLEETITVNLRNSDQEA